MYRQKDKSPGGGTRQGCARSTFPEGEGDLRRGLFPLAFFPNFW